MRKIIEVIGGVMFLFGGASIDSKEQFVPVLLCLIGAGLIVAGMKMPKFYIQIRRVK